MSKQRIVKDEIWDDDWFYELDPSEKLVWLFLLTNPRSNIAGIYKLNKKWSSQVVGLDGDVFNTILSRFIKDGKIIYENNWIAIVNFHKHLAYRNASVVQGIVRIYKESTGCPQAVYSVWLTILNSTLLYLSDSGEKSPRLVEEIKNIIDSLGKENMAWTPKNSEDDSDLPAIDFESHEEVKPKVVKKEKKASDEIQQVFDLFSNPAKVTWRLREIERVAAQALFDTYGLETLKKRLRTVENKKKDKDPYFPHVDSPSAFLEKMSSVERYLGL